MENFSNIIGIVAGLRSTKQDEILKELEAASESQIVASFTDGGLVALEGAFLSEDPIVTDLVKRGWSFIERWADLFAIPIGALGSADIVKMGLDGRQEVIFAIGSGGYNWFESGIRVAFDKKGQLRSVRTQLPPSPISVKPSTDDDFERAIAAFKKWRISEGQETPIPRPNAVLIKGDWLGQNGDSRMVFEFEMQGEDGPASVLVDTISDGETFIPIGVRPEGIPGQTPIPAYHLNPVTNCPDFVYFGHPGCLLPEAVTGDAEMVARAFFRRYPDLYGTGDPDRQLVFGDILKDDTGLGLGITVVFLQHFVGVPVYGCQLRVHMSTSLAILSVSGHYFRDPGVSAVPNRKSSQCFESALSAWSEGGRTLPEAPMPNAKSAKLVIVPSRLTRNGGTTNHLTWQFEFFDESIFVSAESGNVVLRLIKFYEVVNVLDSNQRRAEMLLNNGKRVSIDECSWGATLQLVNGVLQVPNSDLDSEARRLSAAIDEANAFWRRCGRNGWDGAGGDVSGYVDATFVGLNAQARPIGAIVCSRGMVVEDVVGHELTHHLIGSTSNLFYFDESGAANESYADIFGNLIFAEADPEWPIGEGSASGVLRNMRYPSKSKDRQPDTYASYVDTGPNRDEGGVHANSGILNRAAVLLSDGEPGTVHKGIGRSRMARLYFETLTKRLGPWSQFIDVLHNTLAVAQDLASNQLEGVDFPPLMLGAQNKFDGSQTDEVRWAFDQVGLSARWTRGWFKVQGSGTFTQTHYPTPLPGGETVADVTVFARRQDNLRTSNVVRATGAMTDTDPTSGITLTMTVPPVLNTSNAMTVTTVTSPNYVEMFMEAAIDRIPPPVGPGIPHVLPVIERPTPRISHFPTVGGGNRFTDVIYPGQSLPAGCVVEDVALQIWRRHPSTPGVFEPVPNTPLHRLGDPGISGIDFGAYITGNSVGTSDLAVTVNCWHGAFVACRYILIYWIRGNGCELPTFSLAPTIIRS